MLINRDVNKFERNKLSVHMEHFCDLLFQLMKHGTNTLHVVLIFFQYVLGEEFNEVCLYQSTCQYCYIEEWLYCEWANYECGFKTVSIMHFGGLLAYRRQREDHIHENLSLSNSLSLALSRSLSTMTEARKPWKRVPDAL
jgi:hypothetical protein